MDRQSIAQQVHGIGDRGRWLIRIWWSFTLGIAEVEDSPSARLFPGNEEKSDDLSLGKDFRLGYVCCERGGRVGRGSIEEGGNCAVSSTTNRIAGAVAQTSMSSP
ncbi:hypothetical protein CEXT_254971 [Caerostris extrusa]|uniref:Uncharacterized protein n=1 Tax=Caerostris extrusa TaxID=172846 RepID=A0AAV4RT79_CAEEX|nr:hypothetical protein CEXT_254971 [Caerostris extrusa]